ncbi:MAG: hypothetical protein H0X49_07055 [Acidobacteria bacterium]|nr:hypothetical protein [Acidobacteriota bacterium]
MHFCSLPCTFYHPRASAERKGRRDGCARQKTIFQRKQFGQLSGGEHPRIIVGSGIAASVKQIEIRWTSGKFRRSKIPRLTVIIQ